MNSPEGIIARLNTSWLSAVVIWSEDDWLEFWPTQNRLSSVYHEHWCGRGIEGAYKVGIVHRYSWIHLRTPGRSRHRSYQWGHTRLMVSTDPQKWNRSFSGILYTAKRRIYASVTHPVEGVVPGVVRGNCPVELIRLLAKINWLRLWSR